MAPLALGRRPCYGWRRMESSRFDPFGYRALSAQLARGLAEILAAVNNPAWLNPGPPPTAESARPVTAFISFGPIIDVGGQIYAKLDAITAAVAAAAAQEKKDMAAVDDALAALNTAVQAVSDDLTKFAADLAAALAANDPAALQRGIDGINAAATALNAAVAANQAP